MFGLGEGISALGLALNLWDRFKGARTWSEGEILVDRDWFGVAKEKGFLDPDIEYRWSKPDKVHTRLMAGTHELVFALDDKRKIKNRIVRGGLVLMAKRPADSESRQ